MLNYYYYYILQYKTSNILSFALNKLQYLQHTRLKTTTPLKRTVINLQQLINQTIKTAKVHKSRN